MSENLADLEHKRRVSIIVPSYNAERFIARTLESALAQDYGLFDIIVVDDGSTDNTAKIVSEFCSKDERVRIVSTENRGVAAARNTGILESTAEFVAFLDADDLWVSSKLRLQMEALRSRDEYAAAYTWSVTIDENDLITGSNSSWNLNGYVLCQHLITWPVGNGSSLLMRREAALAIGGYNSEFRNLGCGGTEDLDFELRLAEKYKITCVPNFLVGYRRHENSMSSDSKRMARAAILTVTKAIERNPKLPRACSRWGRATAYRYAVVINRPSLDLVRYTLLLFVLDPALCLGAITTKVRSVCRRLWLKSLPQTSQRQAFIKVSDAGIPFSKADPVIRRRAEKLKHVDRMYEAEFSKLSQVPTGLELDASTE
jgi:glycosyltransferase involved in cell wall biosynthesis